MKKVWLLAILLMMTVGCQVQTEPQEERIEALENQLLELELKYADAAATIEKQKDEIEGLKAALENLQGEVDAKRNLDAQFPLISNLAYQFVHAHTGGDAERIRQLVDGRISIEQTDGRITAIWMEGSQEVEWTLWDRESDRDYRDMVIQGYGALEDGSILIHIREFYETDGVELSPPTFLNLQFVKENNDWKIIYFEFDV